MIWKVINHTADYSFRVYGKDLRELFLNSLRALSESMFKADKISDPQKIVRNLNIVSTDSEILLVDWLREVFFLIIAEKILPVKIESLKLSATYLTATIIFRRITSRDIPQAGIKAITYHQAEIRKLKNLFYIDVVCDT